MMVIAVDDDDFNCKDDLPTVDDDAAARVEDKEKGGKSFSKLTRDQNWPEMKIDPKWKLARTII